LWRKRSQVDHPQWNPRQELFRLLFAQEDLEPINPFHFKPHGHLPDNAVPSVLSTLEEDGLFEDVATTALGADQYNAHWIGPLSPARLERNEERECVVKWFHLFRRADANRCAGYSINDANGRSNPVFLNEQFFTQERC
jgi:hypothetical protein